MFSAYTNGFIQSTDAHYTLKVAEKSLRNDAELLNGTIKRSLEPGGDLDGAQKANDTALRLQYISKDTYDGEQGRDPDVGGTTTSPTKRSR